MPRCVAIAVGLDISNAQANVLQICLHPKFFQIFAQPATRVEWVVGAATLGPVPTRVTATMVMKLWMGHAWKSFHATPVRTLATQTPSAATKGRASTDAIALKGSTATAQAVSTMMAALTVHASTMCRAVMWRHRIQGILTSVAELALTASRATANSARDCHVIFTTCSF